MFKFSDKSEQLLNTVDKRLGILANEVLKISPIKFEVIEGLRSEERQKELFKQGKSKTLNSMHLKGLALDILCTKEGYKQAKDIFIVVGLFLAKSKELNIDIRVGALWDNTSTIENSFIDAYHIELANKL